MTHNVATLRLEEPVRFDPDRLETLCHELGEEGAEQVIAQALEQIAVRNVQISHAWRDEDLGEIARQCKGMARIAGKIGMTTLARVAHDVRHCAERGSLNALSATLHRLERIGDQSVHAIWSLEDISV